MKVLVTGVNGQLGHDVMNALYRRGHVAIGSDITLRHRDAEDGSPAKSMEYVSMDITNAADVDSVLRTVLPDAVIHCAAWTAVDAAEESENLEKVRLVNTEGTRNLARVCKQLDCKLLYISTDYVFDGQGEIPWEADCTDYKPLNVYGETKLGGEMAVSELLEKFYIVRIAWVFGANGNNFIKTMLNLGKKYPSVRVVNDQVGTPTYTLDLARLLVDMIETDHYGYYHATNEGGYISWAEFAKEIFAAAGYETKVIPVSTEEYGLSKAKRPNNSRLDKSKLTAMGFRSLPTWQDALSRFLEEIGEKVND